MEVYFILDKPIKVYDPKGVWVEALRFLCYHVKNIKAKTIPHEIVKRTTEYLHGEHGLKYEIARGFPQYYSVKSADYGSFPLLEYIERDEELANCYDQATGIQVLCGALGIKLV